MGWLLLIAWITSIWLHYGMLWAKHVADFYPLSSGRDAAGNIMFFALLFSFFGPLGTIIVFCITGFAEHGLRWTIPPART